MATVRIEISEQLAEQARKAGLLAPEKLEEMLRAQLRREAGERLTAAMDRMHSVDEPPLTAEELRAELEAVRAETKRRR